MEALRRNVGTAFQKVVALSPNLPDELQSIATSITRPGVLADTIALHLPIPIAEKQELLEITGTRARLRELLAILMREVDVLELGSKIQSQVHSEMGKTQREYYLREQMKAIQRELGEGDERSSEIEELRVKIAEARNARGGRKGGNARAGKAQPHAAGRAGVYRLPDLHRLARSLCRGTSTPRTTSIFPRCTRLWTRTTTASRR